MPTYDYRCDACGHDVEIFHSMSEAAKKKCPECGKLKLVRKIGRGGGILFRGSGFYETDYRSDSYKKAAEAESSSSSDAKPADKSAKPADKGAASADKSAVSGDKGGSKKSKPPAKPGTTGE